MRLLLLISTFLISFSTSAQVCRVDWQVPSITVSNQTTLAVGDIDHYKVYLRGKLGEPLPQRFSNKSTRYMWQTGAYNCPLCELIYIRAVYKDGSIGPFSKNACGMNAPDLHSYTATTIIYY